MRILTYHRNNKSKSLYHCQVPIREREKKKRKGKGEGEKRGGGGRTGPPLHLGFLFEGQNALEVSHFSLACLLSIYLPLKGRMESTYLGYIFLLQVFP